MLLPHLKAASGVLDLVLQAFVAVQDDVFCLVRRARRHTDSHCLFPMFACSLTAFLQCHPCSNTVAFVPGIASPAAAGLLGQLPSTECRPADGRHHSTLTPKFPHFSPFGIVRFHTHEVLKAKLNNPRIRWGYLPP